MIRSSNSNVKSREIQIALLYMQFDRPKYLLREQKYLIIMSVAVSEKRLLTTTVSASVKDGTSQSIVNIIVTLSAANCR